jgi:hypothetical protein
MGRNRQGTTTLFSAMAEPFPLKLIIGINLHVKRAAVGLEPRAPACQSPLYYWAAGWDYITGEHDFR